MRKTTWLVLLGVAGTAVPARAEEGGGGGPLSVDGGLVIWTLVVFAMLLYVLRRSAWPVLLAAVREREQRLERQLAEAEKQRQEAAALLEEQKRLLAAGHAEAQEIIAKARGVAEKEREALLARARERSEEHTSELQSLAYLVCRLLLEKKKKQYRIMMAERNYV